VNDPLLSLCVALAGADERMPDTAGVVNHVNRLGDATEDGYQRQHAQQESKFISVLDVANHVANGADIADNWRIGQGNLGDCPGKAEVQREIAE
jgi:hypothetical protein